ncbi:hypothetical protein E1B28_011889 [Marasmius oreades]|nr:uncharacterized protein E1B28_011889 [Marasmius oreades]KAG7090292.1 hypothetical protein E1B28_011889 [Marasmius oreades]
MYTPLIEAIILACPNLQLQLCNTATISTSVNWCRNPSFIFPDIPVYDKANLPKGDGEVDMSKVEFFLEAKPDKSYSGFTNETGPAFERNSDRGAGTRYQLAAYVGGIMASQFRTHCFVVETCADQARLLRYDHGGATVTTSFSVLEESHLVEFFARYDKASPTARGHDSSVERLKPGTANDGRIKETREKLGMESDDPVYRFRVKDEFSSTMHVFYGAKVIVKASPCPHGRSTRGFIAIDGKGNHRFLKDTWRVDLKALDTEGSVYRILHGLKEGLGTDLSISDRRVPHIPTVVASGDVEGPNQKTTKKELWSVKEGNERLYQHYYLVLEEIGKPLDQFEDQFEWISAMADALEAHQKACEIHKISHRDVSVGNILIYDGGGLLIDWEFSKCMILETARQAERTGTWQFMSARLLLATAGEDVPHLMADDLESFFHVLCWVALKHAEHLLSDLEVVKMLRAIFDEVFYMPGRTLGGTGKVDALGALKMKRNGKFNAGPVKDLIIDLEQIFQVRYIETPSEEDLRTVEAIQSVGGIIDAEDENLTDALRWRKRQARLEHAWIFGRFRLVVEKFRRCCLPPPKRVPRENLLNEANRAYTPSHAFKLKRSSDMLSQNESVPQRELRSKRRRFS